MMKQTSCPISYPHLPKHQEETLKHRYNNDFDITAADGNNNGRSSSLGYNKKVTFGAIISQ